MATRQEQDRLLDAFVRRQINLLRLAAGAYVDVEDTLDSSEPRIRALVDEFLSTVRDRDVDFTSPVVRARLDRLRRRISEIRAQSWLATRDQVEEESRELILAQWLWLGAAVATVTGGEVLPNVLSSRRMAREMVRDLPFEGRDLRAWIDDLSQADVDRIVETMVTGLTQRRSRRDILVSIFGTSRMRGQDGVIQQTRNNLRDVMRTAFIHFTGQANDVMAEANEDLFPRDLYVAVLDSRTTPICRSLDGNVYPRGLGPIPPLHFRCRSTRVLLLPGEVPDRPSYQEWLRRQPESFQDSVLGKARARLFRRGGLTLDRFVDANREQFTLAELARREAQAFRDAGLDPSAFTE